MFDPELQHFAQSVESGAPCPVTLSLSAAVVVGVAVNRAAFFDALRELAERTGRSDLKIYAMNARNRDEPSGQFVHLVDVVMISGGQAVDSALTSPDRRTVASTRPPMRVPVADVQGWRVGNLEEVR